MLRFKCAGLAGLNARMKFYEDLANNNRKNPGRTFLNRFFRSLYPSSKLRPGIRAILSSFPAMYRCHYTLAFPPGIHEVLSNYRTSSTNHSNIATQVDRHISTLRSDQLASHTISGTWASLLAIYTPPEGQNAINETEKRSRSPARPNNVRSKRTVFRNDETYAARIRYQTGLHSPSPKNSFNAEEDGCTGRFRNRQLLETT